MDLQQRVPLPALHSIMFSHGCVPGQQSFAVSNLTEVAIKLVLCPSLQAATILAWQPVEVLWSDPQVLAYLDGPAPTHANDETQPGVLKILEATSKALEAFYSRQRSLFGDRLWGIGSDQFKSSITTLVQSRAVLLLARIAHWLQQGPQPGTLDAEDKTWFGPSVWNMCIYLLWQLAGPLVDLPGQGVVHCHRQACAQLLASGAYHV